MESFGSFDWLGELCNEIKLHILSPISSLNLTLRLNNWYGCSICLSWRRSLSYKNLPFDLQSRSMDRFLYDRVSVMKKIYKHLQFFYLTDYQSAPNYVLKCPHCYHQVKKLNQDKQIISNSLTESYALKSISLAKLCTDVLLKFQWQIKHFFTVLCLGPELRLTSPKRRNKLHLNYK